MSGILNNLTFLATVISGVFFNSEPFGVMGAVGSLAIVIGVYGGAKQQEKQSKKQTNTQRWVG
jgi:drug/metabolite transporter (DMT)-like permease